MAQDIPLPRIVTFVMCQRIVTDVNGGDRLILVPGVVALSPRFPCSLRPSFYVEMLNGRDQYRVRIEVRDVENELVDRWPKKEDAMFEERDPLNIGVLEIRDAPLNVPRPGRYDLILRFNGHEVSRRPLRAILLVPQEGPAS